MTSWCAREGEQELHRGVRWKENKRDIVVEVNKRDIVVEGKENNNYIAMCEGRRTRAITVSVIYHVSPTVCCFPNNRYPPPPNGP